MCEMHPVHARVDFGTEKLCCHAGTLVDEAGDTNHQYRMSL
jgi:hypothetical protein